MSESDKPTPAGDESAPESVEVSKGSADPDATRYMPSDASDTDAAEADLTGRTLDDFRILRKLGSGGMASVYLADQMSLGRRVAIKLMSPGTPNTAETQRMLARFRTEAMAAAALTHPNIVQVYTVGESGGLPYIAMEYVPGRNLSDQVRRQGPLKLKLAVHIIRQAARALSAAHAAGVIHRDIKPANILLSPKGEVKVADFGLSQLTTGPLASPGLTQTGTTVGTPRYMSPEQLEGRTVDARSDLYSLGVTLFYVLAGRPPFDSPSPMVLASQHLRDDPPPITDFRADVPERIVDLVESLLAKKPEDRIETADEVVRELGSITSELNGGGEASQPAVKSTPSRKLAKAKKKVTPSWIGLAAVGLASALVGLAAAGIIRPADPLQGAGVSDKKETAKEQFIAAMLSGQRSDFLAVEKYFPGETDWVWRAREQRLLDAIADPDRASEARQLINQFSSRGGERSKLIASVADVALLVYDNKMANAKRLMTRDVGERVTSTLEPVWVDLWREAADRVNE